MTRPLLAIDFEADSHMVAQALIGATLLIDGVGGRIVETGTFEELHRLGGRFAQLTKAQFSLVGA